MKTTNLEGMTAKEGLEIGKALFEGFKDGLFMEYKEDCMKSKDSWCDGDYENCDYRDNCSYADNCSECAEEIDHMKMPIEQSDDCVSREQVVKAMTDWYIDMLENGEGKDFINILDALPPVTPTHGTCKNCKYNRPNSYARTMFSCERGNRFKLRDCKDFYCADFERRE